MEKYESVKERNKINGLKGGRPVKTEEPKETQNNPVGLSGLESVNLETQNNPKKPDTDTDTDTDTDIDIDSETVKKKNIKKKKAEFEKPGDVSEEAWQGWLALRKLKNATVTDVVINAMRKESDLLGWTLEQAMVETCSRNWQGFKASWVQNEMARNGVFQPARPHQTQNRIDGSLNKEEIVLRLKNGAWSDAETLRHLVGQLRTLRLVATQLHEKNDLQRLVNKADLRIAQLTGEKAY
jgi:hypothetical protein